MPVGRLAPFLALFAAALATQARAQGVVAGRVVDSTAAAPRANVIVSIVRTGQTTRTDDSGRFVIAKVPAGEHTIRVRALGYRTFAKQITVGTDSTYVDLQVGRDPIMLGEIRADATSVERVDFETKPNVGTVTLTARAMEAVPRLGDPDVIRVVQMLPGVASRNDFAIGYNVRGGESDQNLILIDNYPLYNPFHLGGLFSTFIDPTVGDIQFRSGAFPATYSGRLSSVLDVRSAEERRPGLHGAVETSVIATTATLGGGFAGGNGSWMLAGRRTYADKLASLFSDIRFPYHFRDGQAHVVYDMPKRMRLSITAYDGRDYLDGSFASYDDSTSRGAGGGGFYFAWGNQMAGATLSKVADDPTLPLFGWSLGDSLLIQQRISRSSFSTLLDVGSESAKYENKLFDDRLGGSITAYTHKHDRTLGYEAVQYDIANASSTGQGSTDSSSSRQRPKFGALYFDDLWRVTPWLLVNAGVRGETSEGLDFSAVSPRLSVKLLASPKSAFTLAAGRYTQWTHSLTLEDNPIRFFDFWRASDSTAPVSSAWHYVAGHERWLGKSHYARIEGFYKKYNNLLEWNVQDDGTVQGDEFVAAQGESYGFDVLARRFETGRLSGWIAYTYAVSTRRQDTLSYIPAQDRRHDLDVVATMRVLGFVAGARIGYASGMPYTEIIGAIPRRRYDPVLNGWGQGGGRVWYEDMGGPRNGSRLPATKRIDVSLSRTFQVRDVVITPSASVVNASNAQNVLFYVYDYTTAPATRRTITQFPILPSVGVNIAF